MITTSAEYIVTYTQAQVCVPVMEVEENQDSMQSLINLKLKFAGPHRVADLKLKLRFAGPPVM